MQIPDEDRAKLLSLLEQHNTMTLCTVDERGMPWSSILFYAAHEDLSLVYISKRESAHSRHLEARSAVSVSIYADHQDRKTARGLQIAGDAEHIQSREDLQRAKDLYLGQFSFIRKAEELFIAFKKMSFYRVRPRFMRSINNAKGMGFKEEWGAIE